MHTTLNRRRFLQAGALTVAGWAVASCGEPVATQVVPIAQRLPEREEARYRLLDADGGEQGTAVLGIASEDALARLTLAYDFGPGRTDEGTVLVRRDSLRPVRAERTVVDGERRYLTRIENDDKVKVVLEDGARTRRREAGINETAYDNLEAIFLWRAIDHNVGTTIRYLNVVVDPRRGTINRALGTVEVMRRAEVVLPAGAVQAWQVEFRSAGITNTAWYRADGTRTLVRYAIARGPTLLLDTVRG